MSPIDQQLMLASGQLISISEAAKNTPYSAEYLSLLARKGRLKAVKISRDWLTTRDAVLEYTKKQALKHKKMFECLQQVKFGSAHYPQPKFDYAGMRGKTLKGKKTIPPTASERGVV